MEDATPRTKLDFIYQEVLGDVSDLVKRLEVVAAAVEEAARARGGERTAEVLEQASVSAAGRLRAEIVRSTEQARVRMAALLRDAQTEAEGSIRAARWNEIALTTGLSLVGAFVGAGLVILCHFVGWW